MVISSKIYDPLKFIALIVLPAFAALYLGLGELWDWPNPEKVVTTLALISTFIGTILQISSHQFQKQLKRVDGFLSATGADPDTGIPNLQLTITTPPDELLEKSVAKLKIGPPPPRQ